MRVDWTKKPASRALPDNRAHSPFSRQLALANRIFCYRFLSNWTSAPGSPVVDNVRCPAEPSNIIAQSHNFAGVTGDTDGTLEHAVKMEKKYPYLVDANGDRAVWASHSPRTAGRGE
jgi:hypothetical protein